MAAVRLRLLLLGLVLAVLLPALAAGAAAAWQAALGERRANEARLRETAQALALALDRELGGVTAAVTAFATSPAFAAADGGPDLPVLHAQARRIAEAIGAGLYVADRDGMLVLTTRLAPGTPLPRVNSRDLVRQVFATGRPAVGDLVLGSVSGTRAFAVGVPVRDAAGGIALMAGASFPSTALRDLLARQALPPGAFAAVTDAREVVVARSDAQHAALVGQALPPENLLLRGGRTSGLFRAQTLDEVERVVAFHAAAAAPGWHVVVAQPAAAFDAAWQRRLLALAGGALIATALGAVLALAAARAVLRPVQALGRHAEALVAGGAAAAGRGAPLPPSGIAELETLRRGLAGAADAMAEREAGLAREADRRALLLGLSRRLLADDLDEAAIARLVFAESAPRLGADHLFTYAVHEGERTRLHLVAAPGLPDPDQAGIAGFDLGEGICGAVAARRTPIVLDAARIAADPCAAKLREMGIRAYVAQPLLAPDGRLLGTLSFGSTRQAAFSPEDADLVQALADLVTLAWQRRRAEAAARDSEAFLRSVLDASADCLKVIEPDGRLAYINGHGRCLMEMEDVGDLIGRDWTSIWPEAERPRLRAALAAAAAGHGTRFEAGCATARGTPRWWDVAVAPVCDARGRVVRVVAASRDITERRRAEEALAASEERLRLATESTGLATWDLDVASGLSTWSASYYPMFGLPVDPAGRGSHARWREQVLPEDVPAVLAASAAARDTDAPFRTTYRIRRADDGSVRWIERIARHLDRGPDGAPRRLVGVNIDVTERRAAEDALAATGERLRLALEAGRMGIFDWDLGTDRMRWDARQFGLFGMDPAAGQPAGADALARVHRADRPALEAAIAAACERGDGAFGHEFRIVLPGGAVRWIAGHGHAVPASDGRAQRMVGLNFDITARREAEATLAGSEARFRLLMDTAPVIVWLTDAEGRCTFLNRAWYETTGQTEAEALGLGWTRATHPEDEARAGAAFLDAVARHGEFRVEYRLRRHDGTFAHVIDAARPRFAEDGRFLGHVGAVFEVGDLKEAEAALRRSEARFRAAVSAVSGVVWTNNARGEMEGEQPGWAALTGQSRAEYQGYGWTRAVHPDDVDGSVASWHEAVAARAPYVFEHRLLTREHGWRRFAVRAIPVLAADGALLEWVGVHTDVTGQRAAEAVLARSHEELERLVAERTAALGASEARLAEAARMEALGRLAGGIAHDFNNVLQAVQGGIALAAKRLRRDPEGAERFLDLAGDSVERGTAVTNRLLSFARRGELAAAAVAPAALLEGLAPMLRHTLGPAVMLHVEVPPGAPAILADAAQLEAVLVNLANNARDALPDGQGTIALAAAPAPPPPDLPAGRYVRISVRDDGEGMTPELLARVAEPFFTTKPKGKGTGLGLAMARGFAEQSGGRLTIESMPGRGTTVSLLLPCAAADAPPLGLAAAEVPVPPTPAARVLVVDDEPGVRATLVAGLAELGHAVAEAEDAAGAVALLEAGVAPDVLVTDLSMPGGLDGLALIREARRRHPGLPAVLVTGHVGDAGPGALEGAAGSGPFAVLRKPVSADLLGRELAGLLGAPCQPVVAAAG